MRSILKKKNKKSGMTTIELVVVFGIFAALATTVLFSYREFSSNTKLQNLTQDIALQIREAQSRSVSGKYPTLVGGQQLSSDWAPSYGLYFSKDLNFNDRFVLFFDDNSAANSNPQFFGDKQVSVINGSVPCDGTTECLDIIQMTGGEYVSKICLDEFIYENCYDQNNENPDGVSDVHIVFMRPLNRAYISTSSGLNDFASDASIYITSATGNTSVVRVTVAGQIIVE